MFISIKTTSFQTQNTQSRRFQACLDPGPPPLSFVEKKQQKNNKNKKKKKEQDNIECHEIKVISKISSTMLISAH